ncbi:MAG TPA: ATP-dependent acyl-CoA ligase [Gaiellaceae bacterium]|nr:ATP-dependent acyl-CoA ligase [Gaiellaceae bacterium]
MSPGGGSERTIPALLRAAADRHGERACLSVGDVRLDYAGVSNAAAGYAGLLAALGVEAGDRVAIVAENRFELLGLWLGCAWRGAVLVPLNTAARGAQLEHMLVNAGPRVLVLEPGLVERLDGVSTAPEELERILVLGPPDRGAWRGVPVAAFEPGGDALEPAPVRPGDTLAILYTSGTTGPSKGVMCPHAQFTWWGEVVGGMLGITAADTLYTCLPLFHTNALNAFAQALTHGAHLVVGPRFSASRFWERVTEADATVTYLLGAMVSMLTARGPSPLDRAHRVRVALAPATPARLWPVFEERFGVGIVEGHGMTETNAAIGPRDGVQRPGWMGRTMPGFDARVVDDDDEEVPPGVPGELVLRAEAPFAFATGYWRLPEATVRAWRNLWFHSGDRVVRDEDGFFRFLDRLHDAIRRRGENVSAWEVEQVLVRHPDVEAAAVIPVPSELGEDEVMACVVPRRGASLDPVDLVRFCEPLLAYFAIPRYVDVVPELPLTQNGKVRKFVLRERGVTGATWDRERAGVELRR